MTKTYANLGLHFLYPENWKITDESASGWPRSVSLETPEDGFWMLQIHAGSTPRELTAQVLKTMRQEYKEVEAEPITQLVEQQQIVGYDMRFYCLDLIVTSAVRGWRHGNANYLLMYQAEDREFDRLGPVFEAMLVNIIRNQNPEDSDIP